jgi:hypothetical protein
MQPFSGDGTDNLIAWLDEFTDLVSYLDSDESRVKIFPHQLNPDSPARAWWNNEYGGDRNCWDEIKAAFVDSWYLKPDSHGTVLESHFTPTSSAASPPVTTEPQSTGRTTKTQQTTKKKNQVRRAKEHERKHRECEAHQQEESTMDDDRRRGKRTPEETASSGSEGTREFELLDKGSHTWPYIISPNQLQGLSDPEVTREDMVMLVLKNAKPKILSLGNISSVVEL